MKELNINYKYSIDSERGIILEADSNLKNFNSDLLNIGDLKTPSKPVEVLAVIFDLEGFTQFTKQVDPKLSIPSFVSDFFNWLFNKIKEEMQIDNMSNKLWAELPFFSKFLGDGVLFLWKIDIDKIALIDKKLSSEELTKLTQEFITNIVATLHDVCLSYKDFLKNCDSNYVDTPTKLRCGVARGDAFPLGLNRDYIGPCINIASRLQKFNSLSFCVCARGIDFKYFHESYSEHFIKKKVTIRGIGDNEIIYIRKDEFKNLPPETKALFK